MPEPVRVGVVGTGSQGRHHVRILSRLPAARLVGVVDLDRGLAAEVARGASTRVLPDLEALAAEAEAAVVAVPTSEHQRVGCRLLESGLHLLVEKPMAASLAEARELAAAAAGRVLAVGHVEFFNPAVQALLDLELAPGFFEIHRLAAFKPRSLDINVILDLMIHDLQLVHALDGSAVREIRANGIHVLTDQIDIANVRIELESGCVANLTASRVSRETVRKMRVFSRAGAYYSLDYGAQRVEEVRLVTTGERPTVEKRELEVSTADALESELGAFLAACRGAPVRLVDHHQGLRSLETALTIVEKMKQSEAAGPRSRPPEGEGSRG